MVAKAKRHEHLTEEDLRHSGIPPRGGIGASKGELAGLIVMLVIVATILVAFYLDATR